MNAAILVILLWCGVAMLLGVAFGVVLRAVSRDDDMQPDLDHDEALARDKAHRDREPPDLAVASLEKARGPIERLRRAKPPRKA